MLRSLFVLALCGACSLERADVPAQHGEAPSTPDSALVGFAESKPERTEPSGQRPAPSPVPQAETSDTKAWPIARPEPRRVAKGEDAVEIESFGDEPRGPLRFSAELGKTRSVGLQMNLAVAMTLGNTPIDPATLPELRVVLDVTPTQTSPQGVTSYEFVVRSSKRAQLEGASARLLAAMDKAVDGMRNTRGVVTFDDRGWVQSVDYGLPELPTPGLRPSLAGFQQSFNQLFPALPEQAVGLGASWVATRHFELSGVPVVQRATYRLLKRDGDALKLDLSFEQFATGDIAAPVGVVLEGTGFAGRGNGSITLGLDSVFPRAGRAQSRTLTVSSVLLGGAGQSVAMDLFSTLSVITKLAP